MELRIYFKILLRWWWLLVLGFAVVFATTLILTLRQPFVYETMATFVIRPRSEIIVDDAFVRTLDLVSRRVEINTTFGEVATSKLIRGQASERLNLSSQDRTGLSVSARVIGGTNILEITAQGRNPQIVRDYANIVGDETVAYVRSLYDVFELEPLDEATIPRDPVKPNIFLNLTLGGIFGLVLGSGLMFLMEYLQLPHPEKDTFNIIDRESGAYNKSYFLHRLWQEMNRARRNQYPLSLGMIKIVLTSFHEDRPHEDLVEALRLVKILAGQRLREEDIITRFDGDMFAVLLPDLDEDEARDFMEELKLQVVPVARDIGGRDGQLKLKVITSQVSYTNYRLRQDQFLEKALHAFEDALLDQEALDEAATRVRRRKVQQTNGAYHQLPESRRAAAKTNGAAVKNKEEPLEAVEAEGVEPMAEEEKAAEVLEVEVVDAVEEEPVEVVKKEPVKKKRRRSTRGVSRGSRRS